MKRISASLAILTVLAGAGPALADSYGAIAYSPSIGALGWSYADDNRGDAEIVARRNSTAAPMTAGLPSGSAMPAARWPSAIAAAGAPAGVTTTVRPSVRQSAAAENKPAAAASSAGNVRRTNDSG
ncbi:hypothetical protein ACU8LZ_13940 [Rhizobium leguminosarum]|uniref:hypothetical protein n=1 Tax=Rhizobium leguminosarum TaxID=384 RepID=UPI001EC43551|nr:hypothetical protein [Rhizobium leguminosarum]